MSRSFVHRCRFIKSHRRNSTLFQTSSESRKKLAKKGAKFNVTSFSNMNCVKLKLLLKCFSSLHVNVIKDNSIHVTDPLILSFMLWKTEWDHITYRADGVLIATSFWTVVTEISCTCHQVREVSVTLRETGPWGWDRDQRTRACTMSEEGEPWVLVQPTLSRTSVNVSA